MKKRFLLQPLTVGLAAALFAVPVFAQEQSEVAQNAAVLVEAANVGVPQAEPVEEVVQAQPENKLVHIIIIIIDNTFFILKNLPYSLNNCLKEDFLYK